MAQEDNKEFGLTEEEFEQLEYERNELIANNIIGNNEGRHSHNNGNGNGDARKKQEQEQQPQPKDEEEEEQLAAIKLNKNDIDFMFRVMMKESKYDELSIRQTVHGLNSAFTRLPIGHVCTSKESGAGKSYIINHVAEFYPNKYQIPLAGVSDKALFHLDDCGKGRRNWGV